MSKRYDYPEWLADIHERVKIRHEKLGLENSGTENPVEETMVQRGNREMRELIERIRTDV